ncbi:MAG: response regulator transcription factor, partial [Bacteroidales bacterium]|nr:response regulator transcription factor [Bacteroidales bacterium]
RILVVEDEEHMLMGLRDNLKFEGYDVDIASDGEEGLSKIQKRTFDLIILDVMLPKISGFDICKKIRHQNIETPIIFLTAKSEEIDKVIGLESGGDDYMTKPFSLRELLARVKAVLRRTQNTSTKEDNSEISIGRLVVDFEKYTALVDGVETKMSAKEYEILHFLWKRKNGTVSRETLLDNIWGFDYQPTNRTIDNFILKLRQKIEDNPNQPSIILTLHGIGYKLIHI